ncbi:MAG: tRNA threonylcarbamoyladenosine biosynthesis protein TsaE [Candidatus Azotimanducaceae bacterium]|jgi:tRNA threonylcarbamoyladenosine biosynthesis protein TsaE
MIVNATLKNEDATIKFASQLSSLLGRKTLIYLEGDLGAGKTTFSRGILRGFGYEGAVKSPTFTIVEPYTLSWGHVYHFDLYRLNDPEELEYIGLDDYLETGNLCLIEWPERGIHFLPECDLKISLVISGEARKISMEGRTEYGQGLCRHFIERE